MLGGLHPGCSMILLVLITGDVVRESQFGALGDGDSSFISVEIAVDAGLVTKRKVSENERIEVHLGNIEAQKLP